VQRAICLVEALVPHGEEFFHGPFDDLLERMAPAAGAIARSGKCGQEVVGPLPGSAEIAISTPHIVSLKLP